MSLPFLPVDAITDELVARAREGAVVLQAPTGSGKTTRVPPALARAREGLVVVLEPRRVAARASARRVAEEWGCNVGEAVGYQVRFDRRIGPRTRVAFVTDGILNRWLLSDPFLEHVTAVVFDEFHERSVDAELALGMLQTVRQVREDLAIVVMSATLDAGPLADFLGAPILRSEGRLHPVDISYAPRPDSRALDEQVADAVERFGGTNVLVFLPGRSEIDRAARRIPGAEVLHGSLDPNEQDAVLRERPGRRVILATNLAESSLTVPGIEAVVDSGLARIPRFDPTTGIDVLGIEPIATDSADQRAGRAGREGPGRCHRLWTARDHRDRPAHTDAALHRTDLAPALLTLLAFGEPDPRAFGWFQRPTEAAIEEGMALLRALGALENGLTPLGEQLANLPLHPRLGRFLLEAHAYGRGRQGARWAAWLADGAHPRGDIDTLEPPASRTADKLFRTLSGGGAEAPRALGRAALAGWPDRLAKTRGDSAVMVGGRGLIGGPGPLFVALQLHPARTGRRGEGFVELAAEVDESWLTPSVRVVTRVDNGKVGAFRQQCLGELVVREHPAPLPDPAWAAHLLANAAEGQWDRVLPSDGPLDQLLNRLRYLAQHCPHPDLPDGDRESLGVVLRRLCRRHHSFGALKNARWAEALRETFSWPARQHLDKMAPLELTVGGRTRRLTWQPVGPPVLAVRIQHILGVRETPQVAGRPVLLHLLAPNGRPQQVTEDLAGFWTGSYIQIRKELRARYPKHPWPEDPLAT